MADGGSQIIPISVAFFDHHGIQARAPVFLVLLKRTFQLSRLPGRGLLGERIQLGGGVKSEFGPVKYGLAGFDNTEDIALFDTFYAHVREYS